MTLSKLFLDADLGSRPGTVSRDLVFRGPLVARGFQSNPGNSKTRDMNFNPHLFFLERDNTTYLITSRAMDELDGLNRWLEICLCGSLHDLNPLIMVDSRCRSRHPMYTRGSCSLGENTSKHVYICLRAKR